MKNFWTFFPPAIMTYFKIDILKSLDQRKSNREVGQKKKKADPYKSRERIRTILTYLLVDSPRKHEQ